MIDKRKTNLIDKVFGNLIVIERTSRPLHLRNVKTTYWNCKCTCGNKVLTTSDTLLRGVKISCGCIKKPRKKYGRRKEKVSQEHKRLKSIHNSMKGRCFTLDHVEYHNYGAKGINVCDRWLSFANFKVDMFESYVEFEKVNGSKSATIDRIDSKGNYEPSNCRWATQIEQARNRKGNIKLEVDGVVYRTISELAEKYQIDYRIVRYRYSVGVRGLDLVDDSILEKSDAYKDSNRRVIRKK